MAVEGQRTPSKGFIPWGYAAALEKAIGEELGQRTRNAGEALADAETRLAARIAALEERVAAIEARLPTPETEVDR